MELEKEIMFKELRNEVANLSLSLTEKLIKKNLDQKTQEKLIDEVLGEIDR